jgi:hypothetical protein
MSVNLAGLRRVLISEGFNVRRCECSIEENVLGLAGAGINKITIQLVERIFTLSTQAYKVNIKKIN